MPTPISPLLVRVIVDIELASGTTFVEAAELAESVPATLIQNREVKEAELIAIKRIDREHQLRK